MPLTPAKALDELSSPDMNQIRILASEIKHPLLEAVQFDERNGLSASEAALLAVIANPKLRAIRDRKRVAAAQLIKAHILPNPELSHKVDAPVGGNKAGKVTAFDLGTNWNISSIIARGDRLDAARNHAIAVDLGIAWQEWQVAEAAKLHVYRLSIAEKKRVLTAQTESIAERAYYLTERAIDVGEKTESDLSKALENLHRAKLAASKARADAMKEHLELNRILGLPSRDSITLEKIIPAPFLREVPASEELVKGLQERRLDLLGLRRGYESQEAKVRAAVKAQFPGIGIMLSSGRDTDAFQTAGAGITLSLPLFDRNHGRIALEKATRKQLYDEYAARLFEARADIARLVHSLRSVQEEVSDLDSLVPALEQRVANFQSAAFEGYLSNLAYYESLSRLVAAKVQKLDLERNLVKLGVALEITSGKYSLYSREGSVKSAGESQGTERSK